MARVIVAERGAVFDVEHGEALERQVAGDAQRRGERRPSACSRSTSAAIARGRGSPGAQERELAGIAATDALHEAAVRGAARRRAEPAACAAVATGAPASLGTHRARASVLD